MEISKEDLLQAAKQLEIAPEQAERLWGTLANNKTTASSAFTFSHVAYYLGAFIIISAMGWLMTLGFEAFGGGGIVVITMIYALLFFAVGHRLWKNEQFKTLGGIFLTLCVWMVPLIIYGLQRWADIWPLDDPGAYQRIYSTVHRGWLFIQLGTIFAALIMLRFYPFPFLTFPLWMAVWGLTLNIAQLFNDAMRFEDYAWVTLFLGLCMLVISFIVDGLTKADYAFWGYFFGMMAFWISMTCLIDTEWQKFIYFLINLGLITLAVLLERRVILVYGAVGVCYYLFDLAYSLFKDSLAFPFVLSLFGIFIIYLGVKFQKNQKKIEEALFAAIPAGLAKFLPRNRRL